MHTDPQNLTRFHKDCDLDPMIEHFNHSTREFGLSALQFRRARRNIGDSRTDPAFDKERILVENTNCALLQRPRALAWFYQCLPVNINV